MGLTRRALLGAGAALPAAWPMVTLPANPDVAIVGAGIAGLTAANALRADNVSVAVLEARQRIGGRAHTDTALFGVPYDLGAAELHSAKYNPLTRLVTDEAGFATLDRDETDMRLVLDGEKASDADFRKFGNALFKLLGALNLAWNDRAPDSSVYDLQTPRDRFEMISHALTGIDSGVDTTALSWRDLYVRISPSDSWMVPQGLAAGIYKALGPIPVQLDTVVEKVHWNGSDIRLQTSRGTLRCKAVIITVPTEIVADGSLTFEPALPAWKMAAFEGIPMGVVDKVALQFRSGFGPLTEGANTDTLIVQHGADGQVWYHLLRPFGHDLCIGYVGGYVTRALTRERDSERTAVALALENLAGVFGSEVERLFVKGHYTRWLADRFARGAFSAALPGRLPQRAKLREPIDNKLFFAGEAADPKWATQAAGAYRTGLQAAEEAKAAVT